MTEVLDPPKAALNRVAQLRTQFRDGKAELLARFAESRPTAPAATRLIRALTQHVDRTLLAAWHHAGMPASTALIAVGGYGRAELFPHSDVDVLVLLPPRNVAVGDSLKASIEAFITACWDIGLEIGSSESGVSSYFWWRWRISSVFARRKVLASIAFVLATRKLLKTRREPHR